MSVDADLVVLRLAGDRFVGSLGAIGGDQWRRPTPCDDWDVQALVDHVVGGNWFTFLILSGLAADDAMGQTIARFEGGSATVEQAANSVAEQQVSFEQPGALDQTVHHVAGELSGRQVIRLRLHDLIAHTWDLERSLGREATIPDELVRWGLDELASPGSLTTSHFASRGIAVDLDRAGDGADESEPDEAGRASAEAGTYLRLLGRATT